MVLENLTLDELDTLSLDNLYILELFEEIVVVVPDGITVLRPSVIINNYGRATVKTGYAYANADIGSSFDDNSIVPSRVNEDVSY